MKSLVIALLCTLVCFGSYGADKPSPDNTLTVSGFFKSKKNISYEVCKVEADMSCTIIDEGKGMFAFNIDLEIGSEYVISFTKNGVTKHLYVTATEPGISEVDVDFESENSATMTYDHDKHYYTVRVLLEPKYDLVNDKYIVAAD